MTLTNSDNYVAIIDYDLGNLFSVQLACNKVGLKSVITSNKKIIENAPAAILPGVGAFGEAMNHLDRLDLVSPIKDFSKSGKPLLGICLGMQLFFSESEEFGSYKGLGLIEGSVSKFPSTFNGYNLKVPQIQWNNIYSKIENENSWKDTLLINTKQKEFMYFVHSFFVLPIIDKEILTMTNYEGFEYCSGVKKDNIYAFQFHPEKSGIEGLKIFNEFKSNLIR